MVIKFNLDLKKCQTNFCVFIDVETFSMDTGNNRITACIQVKLQSFY